MKKIKRFLTFIAVFLFSVLTAGCSDYGYEYHFYVEGGNGNLMVEELLDADLDTLNQMVTMCDSSSRFNHGINCPDNSKYIVLLGGKKGQRELTFVAIPDEGYKVKEWKYNFDVVENYKENFFNAIVTSSEPHPYQCVVSVSFERI